MLSTHTAALLRVALKTMACAAVAFAVVLSVATAPAGAQGKPNRSPCANRLCTKYKPHTSKCWDHSTRTKISRCFIRRAAAHYHQNVSQAYYIAHRESHYNYRVTNPSSGTAGLYQFARRTWQSTPYGKKSPYNPRWAALGAMWMWAHGGMHHWAV